MDVTKPAIQIFYGKYLDAITNEIPADHIPVEKNGPFQITLEPGKPNFPTNDTATITLANLDADGTELYPKQWFIDESKSEAEGAVYPFELFFRVYTYGEAAFTGIYGEKKYSINNDEVTISLNSIVGLLDKKDRALKGVNYSNIQIYQTLDDTSDDYVSGEDLNGDPIGFSTMSFYLFVERDIRWVTDEDEVKSSPEFLEFMELDIIKYLNLDNPDLYATGAPGVQETVYEYYHSLFIQINDQTILTTVLIGVYDFLGYGSPKNYDLRLGIKVFHANNTNYETADFIILQRGRFFKENGESYSSISGVEMSANPEAVNLTVYLPSNDYYKKSLIKDGFLNGTTFMHGTPVVGLNPFVIQASALNTDYIDVFSYTLESISEFYSNFFETPGSADFFDITNVLSAGRKAFIADALMFNWIGEKNTTKDLIVSLARQTNCYLYADAMGKIVYQSRSLHDDDYVSETTPASAVDLDSSDYFFSSGQTEDFGFDTFEIEIPADIVEINNLVSDQDQLIYVNENGEVDQPGLRNTRLELSNFRLYNLAVPEEKYASNLPLFRKSPEDNTFPGYTANLMGDFIQHPVTLAAAYAKRFVWPTEFIYPKLPGQHYPTIKEGGLMYRDKDGVRTIYLVTRIDRSAEMFKTIELKKEAEWEVV